MLQDFLADQLALTVAVSSEDYVITTRNRRMWFLCPCCQRPCRVLYGSWHIACRRCHGLRYRSQSEGETVRATSGMFKVIKRLDPRATDNKLPPKPKGMHWRTYQRLADRYHSYGTKWAVAIARQFRIET